MAENFEEQFEDDFVVEVGDVSEPEPAPGPDPFAEIERLKSEMESIKSAPPPERDNSSDIERLAKQMSQMGGQQPPPQQVGESDDDFFKRVRENFLEDPAKYMDEFNRRKLGPAFTQVAERNVQFSRRFLELDPERRETFQMYREEIDSEVKKMPPQERFNAEDIYSVAHDKVVARHWRDIVDRKVKEAAQAPAPEVEVTSNGPTAPTGRTPAGAPQKRIRITEKEAAAAASMGLSPQQYVAGRKGR